MTDKMELLKRTRLFVLDMDGTFYLGERILPGAAEFLQAVKAAEWVIQRLRSSI